MNRHASSLTCLPPCSPMILTWARSGRYCTLSLVGFLETEEEPKRGAEVKRLIFAAKIEQNHRRYLSRRKIMSHPEPLSQWMETVSTMLPNLSRPQAKVLAYWSYGMVLAKSCGITLVCAALALQLGSTEQSLLQRLREWCYGAKDKKGEKRRELDVSTCFGPLVQWILAWWPADQPRLALALDATTLKKRFTVLVMSVVYRGCAIPVAWKVVPATAKHAWRREWLRMLRQVRR